MYVIRPRLTSFTVTEDAKLGYEVVQKPVCKQATHRRDIIGATTIVVLHFQKIAEVSN
jgi:hypothetical protein